ncbi:MAG: FAD binding domain-containing protein [Myxococcota bacterium]|nr:FAD binding domain-containing protein [Myxococcota bacterium]
MLRLPKFELAEPESVEETIELLNQHGNTARLMAGGTDLMPNMKHEFETPEVVIGLWKIPGISGVTETEDSIRIGAMTTVHDLGNDPVIAEHCPSLSEACRQIAGPQLRRMGTIGGNVCLDTRCVYINQTYFWRQALGFCAKKDGTVCHVVKGGTRCVAAASNDSGPVLMSLGASLRLVSIEGERVVSIDDFYRNDGEFNQRRERNELLTEISIPKPKPNTIMAYQKLRTRAAIDYPELGVAVLAELDTDRTILRADICVTALGPKPIHIGRIAGIYENQKLDDKTIKALADAAQKRCKPLTNIASDPSYRREMVSVSVRRAFEHARSRNRLKVV